MTLPLPKFSSVQVRLHAATRGDAAEAIAPSSAEAGDPVGLD
ncbi:hypothetical protein [Streptomyces sp. YIM S03343]